MSPVAPFPLLAGSAGAALLALCTRAERARLLGARGLLVALLLSSEAVLLVWPALDRTWSAASDLPFQLSDASTLLAVVALCQPRLVRCRAVAYVWSVGAGVLGLTFPAIGAASPSPLFFAFYVDHGTLLAAGILLATVPPRRFQLKAAVWAWAATVSFAVLAAVADLITGGDYMFLRQPPSTWSPLLLMGAWPWYLLAAFAITPVLFVLLLVPVRSGSAAPDRIGG